MKYLDEHEVWYIQENESHYVYSYNDDFYYFNGRLSKTDESTRKLLISIVDSSTWNIVFSAAVLNSQPPALKVQATQPLCL